MNCPRSRWSISEFPATDTNPVRTTCAVTDYPPASGNKPVHSMPDLRHHAALNTGKCLQALVVGRKNLDQRWPDKHGDDAADIKQTPLCGPQNRVPECTSNQRIVSKREHSLADNRTCITDQADNR